LKGRLTGERRSPRGSERSRSQLSPTRRALGQPWSSPDLNLPSPLRCSRLVYDGVVVQVKAEPGPAVVDAVRLEHPLIRRSQGGLRPRTDERPLRQARTGRQSHQWRGEEVSPMFKLSSSGATVYLGSVEGVDGRSDRGAQLARPTSYRMRAKHNTSARQRAVLTIIHASHGPYLCQARLSSAGRILLADMSSVPTSSTTPRPCTFPLLHA
jgi:hypothetical protein